eukprot:gnl/TRDRNA2_/TRDRNA2_183868_c0_seq1.p1 gnl/TRDRNA2_/TRDRNA2_183868_c0~~gnl/TRDRNA2_/TRDRNA2_183868_c0_seq1.p1  ORF type:complete len:284 (+),score=89.01 gnl/TRDRNA2_/TRDRNA2_183868_c0_seq1:75-926(+)
MTFSVRPRPMFGPGLLLLAFIALELCEQVAARKPTKATKEKMEQSQKAKKNEERSIEIMMPKTPAEATRDVDSLAMWLKSQPKEMLTLPDPSGLRLTHWAASGGSLDVLKALVKKGADPWDGTATAEEQSALHMACQSGAGDIVDWMLSDEGLLTRSRGSFTLKEAADRTDKKGTSCLHFAATAGHADVIRKLVNAGADMQAETVRSGTPLHSAAALGHEEAVKVLIRLGADVCALNMKDQTPGYRARAEENYGVAKILEPHEEAQGCPKKQKKKKKKGKSDL